MGTPRSRLQEMADDAQKALLAHPEMCRTCYGAGDDPKYPADYCPDCVSNGHCPVCGSALAYTDAGTVKCTACQWSEAQRVGELSLEAVAASEFLATSPTEEDCAAFYAAMCS